MNQSRNYKPEESMLVGNYNKHVHFASGPFFFTHLIQTLSTELLLLCLLQSAIQPQFVSVCPPLFLILWTIFNINSQGGGGDGVYFQWQSLVFSLSAAVEIKL